MTQAFGALVDLDAAVGPTDDAGPSASAPPGKSSPGAPVEQGDPRPGAEAAAEALLERARQRQRAEAEARGDPLLGRSLPVEPQEAASHARIEGIVAQGALEMVAGPGEFDTQLVDREIKKRLRAMQVCYEWLLRRDPALRGIAVVDFTLQPGGTMASATLALDRGSEPRLDPCSAGVIRRFRFNPGSEGGNVSYRQVLSFQPADP